MSAVTGRWRFLFSGNHEVQPSQGSCPPTLPLNSAAAPRGVILRGLPMVGHSGLQCGNGWFSGWSPKHLPSAKCPAACEQLPLGNIDFSFSSVFQSSPRASVWQNWSRTILERDFRLVLSFFPEALGAGCSWDNYRQSCLYMYSLHGPMSVHSFTHSSSE